MFFNLPIRLQDEFKTNMSNQKISVDGVEFARLPISDVDVLSPIIKPDKVITKLLHYYILENISKIVF